VSVTLVLASDTVEETVDEVLRLFGVCVLFVVSMLFRVAPFVNWSMCVVLLFSDRLFVLNIGVCTTIIRVRFRNV
jgi:ABC-type polysaccharide/polyol phosphate export permease